MVNIQKFVERGIDLYYVGGCCRDWLLSKNPQDIDYCMVSKLTDKEIDQFLLQLKRDGDFDDVTPVFGSFPIWIITKDGKKYEFAMARTEKRSGSKRTEFDCIVKDVTIQDDLKRRDFTVNAIARSVSTGQWIDPFNGIEDLKRKILRPTSEAFKEDALRVIRGARFAATLGFKPSEEFFKYSSEVDVSQISKERVGIELMKVFKQAKKPSIFFNVLREIDWLKYYFKPLEDTIGCPQNPEHHPEGDVYTHTMHCIDACKEGDWFTRAVMLCHDLGKATTTTVENGKIRAIGHEHAGVILTHQILGKITFASKKIIQQIALLVELHMIRINLSEKTIRRSLRRLMSVKLKWEDLVEVCRCDLCGRPPIPCPEKLDMQQEFVDMLLSTGRMAPIVTGKLLTEYGLGGTKETGEIIKKALEFQDRGTLTSSNWKRVLSSAGYKQFKNHATTKGNENHSSTGK